jgi:hypothetical protein
MAEQLDDLIDELEDVLADGRRLPFTGGRLLVDEDRLLDVIDRMRAALPESVRRAQRVLAEQERLMAEAQTRVKSLLDERGLNAALDDERLRLLAAAEADAEAVRRGADEYARHVLLGLDERLARIRAEVRSGLATLDDASQPSA